MAIRSRTEINSAILQCANARDGVTKSRIMYDARLKCAQIQRYLPPLQENSLIVYVNETSHYKTTERGLEWLSTQEEADEIIACREARSRLVSGVP